MNINQNTDPLCTSLPLSRSVCRHSPYSTRQIHNGDGGERSAHHSQRSEVRGQKTSLMLNTTDVQPGLRSFPEYDVQGPEILGLPHVFFFCLFVLFFVFTGGDRDYDPAAVTM
ncbi:rCG41757 [Rattus norvegicus]|uniref:RCG41757 n=1 Tax=Rattus norvegicus TaxID=10116 RepID=A6KT44_RAT|nr:rCG41757 [Rattus norvegicus]